MPPSTIVANGMHLFSLIPECLVKNINGPERSHLVTLTRHLCNRP